MSWRDFVRMDDTELAAYFESEKRKLLALRERRATDRARVEREGGYIAREHFNAVLDAVEDEAASVACGAA